MFEISCAARDLPVTRIFRAFAFTVLFIVFCGVTRAQDSGAMPLGQAPGAPAGSYSLSGFESVNFFNGHLNFRLPLVTMGGRGGAGHTLPFVYEQKWVMERYYDPGQQANIYYASDIWRSGPDPGFSPGVMQGHTIKYFAPDKCSSGGILTHPQTLSYLTFTGPDGTQYNLYSPHGRANHAQCITTGFNRGRVFRSTDGSATTFVSDADVLDYPMPNYPTEFDVSGYLLLRDGTRYRVSGGQVTEVRDRNGNRVTFGYSGSNYVVTDSLERTVTVSYGVQEGAPYGLCTKLMFGGFSGTPRTIRISWGELSGALRPDYTLKTYAQLGSIGDTPYDPKVPTHIWLPDGERHYRLRYNDRAELARVELPTGGAIEYDHAQGLEGGDPSGIFQGGYDGMGGFSAHIYRRVVERRVYPDGINLKSRMTISRPEGTIASPGTGYVEVKQFERGPDGSEALLTHEKHYFHGSARPTIEQSPFVGPPSGAEVTGREARTDFLNTSGVALRKVEHSWQPGNLQVEGAHVTQTITTLLDSGQATKQTFAYDIFNNQTDVWDYDYGTGAPPPYPTRHTHTEYLTTHPVTGFDYSSHSGVHIRSLPRAQQVYSVNPATGLDNPTPLAQSETRYDEYPLLDCDGVGCGGAVQWVNLGASRGNATTTRSWLDTNNTWLENRVEYDQLGNVRQTWDGRTDKTEPERVTQIEYSAAYKHAYPTHTKSAVPDLSNTRASNTPLESWTTYDLSTGKVISTTDANSKTTTYQYADVLDRLTRVDNPDNGWTTYWYGRNAYGDYVGTRTSINATQHTEGYQFFDGLGRSVRSFQLDGSQRITSDTEYDALGRVRRVSNPYLTGGSGTPINPSGDWTTTAYDALGRVTTVTTPDGAVVSMSYSGNNVTVTDQAGKRRKSVTDALGRLMTVYEDPSVSGYTGLNYQTNYSYDVLGNLRKVDQGGQLRFFMYDSLGRLIRAKNPEQTDNTALNTSADPVSGNTQWSFAYAYDNNGNLSSRTDVRGVTTSYQYDNLNRNTVTSYTNDPAATPTVERYYDGPIGNGKGRLHYHVTTGATASRTIIESYDVAGRPLVGRQHFATLADVGGGVYWRNQWWSPPYQVSQTYDLMGHVTRQIYPSGHEVNYSQFDVAGRLKHFAGNLGDGTPRTYATNIQYDAAGRLTRERFDTQTPLYHKQRYNVRGQLYDVRLSSIDDADNWNRGQLLNHYSHHNGVWGSAGPDDNGNVLRTHHFVPGDDQVSSWSVNYHDYAYDALNRLSSVSERRGTNGGGDAAQFSQAFTYDRWGNRTINQAGTTQPAPNLTLPPGMSKAFSVDTQTNRLGVPGGQLGTMTYDFAGNLTDDTYTGAGARVYDAENRMTSAAVPDITNNSSTYTYDAEGRRVRRQTPSENVWQAYGLSGELLAEYAANSAPALPQKEYGYRHGELLVTAQGATETNFALNQTATQSSTFDATVPATRAVDGTTAGSHTAGTLSHTNNDVNAWWHVDMGSVRAINSIKVWNRADCCTGTTSNFYVLVSDAPFTSTNLTTTLNQSGVSNYYVSGAAGAPTSVTVGRNGRYVRVQLSGTNYLTLSEVEVWGTATPTNVALYQTATQSSTFDPGSPASRAVDGVTAGSHTSGTISHTNNDVQAWWQVDLGSVGSISTVKVWNRADCCRGTTADFYVLVSDAPFTSTNLSTTLAQAGVSHYHVAAAGAPTSVTVGRSGRYVRVQLAGTNYLTLSEVEVFDNPQGSGTGGAVQWLVSDHLGTPRMIADLSGSLDKIKRHDYLPFGEEVGAGVGGRTQQQGYSQVDNVRQKFAGTERDGETGLDFMQARYYSSTMGRFTSPDEPYADQEEADPQSWNLYSYVRNNPLRFIDPFGLARYDANGNWVGDKDGEYDKDLKAHWRVDKNNPLGGSWDFGGDQSPITVNWTIFDEASMQLTVAENQRSIARIADDGCEDCAMEMGVSGRSLAAMARVIAGRTPSKLLDSSLRASGLIRPAGTAAHHIVAHGSRKASIARRILKRLGVDVNSAENGVYLPRNVNTPGQGATHSTLHTDRYYAEVDRLISTAQTKQQAVEILNYIRGELLKNTFPR